MTVINPAAVDNWLDARSALAFDDRETNRLWEQQTREALGTCMCGKPATHLTVDEDHPDWACRVPEVTAASVVHFWWLAEAPDPEKPWSRALCDRGQESRFPAGSVGLMSPNWAAVTCPECKAAQ